MKGSYSSIRRRLSVLIMVGFLGEFLLGVSGASPTPVTGTIEGTVVDARILDGPKANTVVVPDDLKPVRGATVRIPALVLETTTDDNGSFRFDAIPAVNPYSKVDIEVNAPGYAPYITQGFPVRPGLSVSMFIELTHRSVLNRSRPPEERMDADPASSSAASGLLGEDGGEGIRIASTCSGYSSNARAPRTIKVYRRSVGGGVVTYDFIFYVKHVLASEWIPTWNASSLRAGAVAVRNYGWYWINNWRGGSVGGQCYDVDDTTNYQVFNPGLEYTSTSQATDAIWYRLARKSGQIFESQYRATLTGNQSEACGAGADGTKMSQYGSKQCADGGMSWWQIVTTYYYPSVAVSCLTSPCGWSGWGTLGNPSAGGLTSAPDVASWEENRYDVFARAGASQAIYQRTLNGSTWQSWQSIGGGSITDPAAVSWGPGRIDVFIKGGDNALWHQAFDNGAWQGWESLGGVINSGPDVASWGPNRLDVFVRGMDNKLWHICWNGSWCGWEGLDGTLASDPGAVSWWKGRIDIFSKSPEPDGQIWHKYWDDATGWSGWEGLWKPSAGLATSPGNPGPDAVSWGFCHLNVYATASNQVPVHRQFTCDGGWTGWTTLDGGIVGGPGVGSWSSGRLNVFGRGTNNQLWHKPYG